MRISYDPEVDALYICLDEEPHEVTTQRLTDDVAIDYAPDGHIIGIEVLDASAHTFPRGAERTIAVQNLTPITVP